MLAAFAALGSACSENLEEVVGPSTTEAPPTSSLPVLRPEVIAELPHDPEAYTQGLEVRDGRMYESTGLRGRSTLREVDMSNGEVLRRVDLTPPLFGEGIALVDDRIIQLTWQEHTALVYDVDTFAQVGTFSYDTQGWGLCFDGTDLLMSDGTSRIFRRDPYSFEIKSITEVTRDGQPQPRLNELECVDGRLWANIYQTDTIVEIDPVTGKVVTLVDASGLLRGDGPYPGVLNGIAYDESNDTFLLTGKNWPSLFVVDFVPSPGEPGR